MPRPPSPRTVETRAYNRAADLAKSYAEHWEHEATNEPTQRKSGRAWARLPRGETWRDWDAATKAGHWRVIEKEIRALARQPEADDKSRRFSK
jgi:hypothetical protein